MSDCKHDSKIQVIRKGRRYIWSCAECGKQISVWSDRVWKALLDEMPHELAEGEGFVFRIEERGE